MLLNSTENYIWQLAEHYIWQKISIMFGKGLNITFGKGWLILNLELCWILHVAQERDFLWETVWEVHLSVKWTLHWYHLENIYSATLWCFAHCVKDEKHGFDEKRRQLNLSGCPRLPTRYKKSANYKDWCYKMLLHCSVHSRSKDQGTIKPVAKFPRNYSALTFICQEWK